MGVLGGRTDLSSEGPVKRKILSKGLALKKNKIYNQKIPFYFGGYCQVWTWNSVLIGIIQRRWRDKTGRRGSDYRANRAICLQNLAYMFKIGGENKSNFCPHVMFIKGVCLVSNRMLSSAQFSSVAQSCPTLWPQELKHARPPCPSPTPGVHSDSRPSSPWCHPAISSSVVPFSSCP